MPQPIVPGQETLPSASAASSGVDHGGLPFEVQARRKDDQEWRLVARLRHEDDAKAALWAIVFTGQYAAVTVRRDGSTSLVAEWPAGLSGLR